MKARKWSISHLQSKGLKITKTFSLLSFSHPWHNKSPLGCAHRESAATAFELKAFPCATYKWKTRSPQYAIWLRQTETNKAKNARGPKWPPSGRSQNALIYVCVAVIKMSLPHKMRTKDVPRTSWVLLERRARIPLDPRPRRANGDQNQSRPWVLPSAAAALARCHGYAARLAPMAAMLSLEPKCVWHPKPAQPLTRQIIPQESSRGSNKNCDCSSLITFYGSLGDRRGVTKMKLWVQKHMTQFPLNASTNTPVAYSRGSCEACKLEMLFTFCSKELLFSGFGYFPKNITDFKNN